MKIIKYRNCDDIDVQFMDSYGYIRQHITTGNFKNGKVKNPYDRTVYGVGMLGVGRHKARKDKNGMHVKYLEWKTMLERCYANNGKHPAYYGICTVCDEWQNYQIFADWFEEHYYEVKGRLHLDKDILVPGNKVYSPETCVLIPQRINMLFMNMGNAAGLPNGIRQTSAGRYSSLFQGISLGTYDTLEEAFSVYAKEKECVIKQIANEYKNIIPNNAYDALMNYEVRIENDKNYISS